MTQLFNKNAIENKIHAMIEQANDTHTRIAVGFLDIDNFRDYNTLYGHQEGDRVIRFVASILKENIDGIVGRNGGDEFLFCLAAVEIQRQLLKMKSVQFLKNYRKVLQT